MSSRCALHICVKLSKICFRGAGTSTRAEVIYLKIHKANSHSGVDIGLQQKVKTVPKSASFYLCMTPKIAKRGKYEARATMQ